MAAGTQKTIDEIDDIVEMVQAITHTGLYKVSGQQRCPLYIVIFRLWYEVGSQHVKALQAAAISPY